MIKRILTLIYGLTASVVYTQEIDYKPDPKVIKEALLPPSRYGKFLFDILEYNLTSEDKEFKYDAQFWFGGDVNRIWIEAEGEHSLKYGNGSFDRADVYYAKLIAPFWDFRVGVGSQGVYGDVSEERVYGVMGIQGLAPYWFEIDTNLRMDTKGRISTDLEIEYDLLITQRLILQPRFETTFYLEEIPELGVGGGLSNTEVSVRLRYEIRREIAPYIGAEWIKFYGDTKKIRESFMESTNFVNVLLGLRIWY